MRNPLTMESLRDWLKTKDPKEEYNYEDGGSCCLYQYYQEKGFSIHSMGVSRWKEYGVDEHRALPDGFNYVARPTCALSSTDTWGNALARAETMIANARELELV